LHPNVVLTEMLDNVGEFPEIAKVKYKVPVAQQAEAEELEDGQNEDASPDEQLAAAYEVKFDEVVSAGVVRTDRFSFAELCTGLKEYALERGINLEASSARALIAAIASTKLVFLTSKNPELLPQFVEIVNAYFGNETRVIANDGWHNISDLLWNAEADEGTYVLSTFSNAVYAAHMSPEQEKIVIIDNVNLKNLGSYFYSFLEYANHPTEEFVISFNEETSFPLPDNLTYILVPQGGVIEALPTEILNAAVIADVMLTRADVTPEIKTEPKVVSHEDFRNVLNEIKEVDFVSERIWKKVDELAETINSTERFAIGNKNIIQLESFTSVMIDCGADEAEAVTQMFLAKLAFILKNTHAYRQDGGEKTVFGIIERLFADEELLKIKRVLNKPAKVVVDAQPETQDTQPAVEESAEGVEEQNVAETDENIQNEPTVDDNGIKTEEISEEQTAEQTEEQPAEQAEEQPEVAPADDDGKGERL
ncbi:MAG: hypothetical protein K2K39_01965, partial [Clostridia bacterium]|nr:hypothetical protein [Clostridia bacterium]